MRDVIETCHQIWEEPEQRDIPFDKIHDQILGFPYPKYIISPHIHSPTGKARGTLPFGLIE